MDTARLPCLKANKGLLNSTEGPLQRQLRSGEYNLFRFASMFESDFVQVSKRGGTSDVHNQVQQVRVAVAATSPGVQVPNVLLLARPVRRSEEHTAPLRSVFSRSPQKTKFELTRLLPLCFVKISVHNWEKQQLRFKMATGRTFYLQFLPQEKQTEDFETWVKIVQLLRPPADLNLEKKHPEPELLKPGEPVLLSAEASRPDTISTSRGKEFRRLMTHRSSESQSSEERGSSTVAEILSVLQEESHDDPHLVAPSGSHPEKMSFALFARREEELMPTPGFMLLPSGGEESKPESPPPSEGPGEAPKKLPSRPRTKAKSKHRSGSRKKNAQSKPRRSHSAQKVGRNASRFSSLLRNSFSITHQTHSKRLNKSREKQH